MRTLRRPISYKTTILAALLLAAALTFPAAAPAGKHAALGSDTEASLFAAQPDGKLLLSGSTDTCKPFEYCSGRRLFVARMLRSGQLDPDFGGGEGIAVIPFKGSSARITDASLMASGRIVVVGAVWTDEGATSFAICLKPDGKLDRSFGSAGRVELPIDISNYGGVAIDRRGRIIVAGSSYPDFAVTAVLPSGRLDETFGTDGVATAHFSPAALFDEAEGLAILSGNRILVSGTSEKLPSESYIGLAQLLADGSLDPSFGEGDGLAIGPGIRGQTGDDPGTDRSGGSPIVTDDSIMIVGHAGRSGLHQCPSGLITRFGRDGVWDPAYGSAGTRLFRCTSGFRGTATADGHLLVSGTADFYDLSYPRIGRFDADGNADREFQSRYRIAGVAPRGSSGLGDGAHREGELRLLLSIDAPRRLPPIRSGMPGCDRHQAEWRRLARSLVRHRGSRIVPSASHLPAPPAPTLLNAAGEGAAGGGAADTQRERSECGGGTAAGRAFAAGLSAASSSSW